MTEGHIQTTETEYSLLFFRDSNSNTQLQGRLVFLQTETSKLTSSNDVEFANGSRDRCQRLREC